MRILLAAPKIEIGGVQGVFRTLCDYLRSQGHEVFVLHLADGLFLERNVAGAVESFGLRFQPLSGKRPAIIRAAAFAALMPLGFVQLIRLIRRLRIQVVNIHYPDPADAFLPFALCRRVTKFALVTSIHGADIFPHGRRRPSYPPSFRAVFNASDLIVAPSRAFQEEFLNIFPALRPRTTFIYNGFKLPEKQLAGRPGQGDLEPYILSVSALKHAKALDVLIRAFAALHTRHPELNLVLVGEGILRRELEELACKLGLREKVHFLGRVEHERVPALISGCRVFVLPSRFETFGIAALEAMALRKPVIATRVGGLPEIIEDGVNGILVPPDDDRALAEALQAVLTDENLGARLARAACESISGRFDLATMGAAYVDAYRRLTSARGINSGPQATEVAD